MSRWPDDPTSYKPSPKWFGLAVIGLMVAILVVLGTGGWMGRHHDDLIGQFSGVWFEQGGGGAARLRIEDEMQVVETVSGELRETPTGDLAVSGRLDGRSVSGRIDVSGFPPWSSTLHAALRGQRWTLRYDAETVRLTATNEGGRQIRFALGR